MLYVLVYFFGVCNYGKAMKKSVCELSTRIRGVEFDLFESNRNISYLVFDFIYSWTKLFIQKILKRFLRYWAHSNRLPKPSSQHVFFRIASQKLVTRSEMLFDTERTFFFLANSLSTKIEEDRFPFRPKPFLQIYFSITLKFFISLLFSLVKIIPLNCTIKTNKINLKKIT